MRQPPETVQLIALDLDGTVLDHEGNVSDRVLRAVREVSAAGKDVVVATGRGAHSTLPILERLGLRHGWAVCSNGAVTLRLDADRADGYEIVDVRTFDPAPVVRLLREELPEFEFAVEDAALEYLLTVPFPEGELNGPQRVVPIEELIRTPTTRVVARSWNHSAEEFVALASKVGMRGVNYFVGWTGWLDIAPEGVNKAGGLELIRQRLGVPAEATLAMGDGRNDIEMFAWAAWSVAMGQAVPEVRQLADAVAPGVAQDGVAVVLESWFLR